MTNEWLKDNRKGLMASLVAAVYVKFLLLPTATFFYEAYHLLKLDFLYIGYQVFKAAGYAMSGWDYSNLTVVVVTVTVFLIYRLMKMLGRKKTKSQKAA